MTEERFFYHSFPRSKRDSDVDHKQALAILESILDRGLLLTPEVIRFREHQRDGSNGPQWDIVQKRVCFTELPPSKLPEHAKEFGSFALEWTVETLRAMGAIPAFYVPMHAPRDSLEGVGTAMLARLGEMQLLLGRLNQLRQTASRAPPHELIPIAGIASRASAGGVEDLLTYLSADTRSFEELQAALKWMSGLVYPVDNPRYPGPLRYYRQREWKMLANMLQNGVAVAREVDANDVAALLALDPEFFGKDLEFDSRSKRRAEMCQFFDKFRDKPVASFARRIVVPASGVNAVRALLTSRGISLEVAALEGGSYSQ